MRILVWFLFVLAVFAGCEVTPKADQIDAARQEQSLKQAQAQVGLPGIINFQEKKELKQIYELRDQEKLVCYAYFYNEFTGKLVYFGKCLGYGIPYSTQFSNPDRIAGGYETPSTGNVTIPQAEPNGLFMPNSSEATWLLMLDETGASHPVYVEPRIIVSPFKLVQ